MPERNVNSIYAQAGMLNEVVSPTDGSTKYEFESNRAFITKPLTKKIAYSGSYLPVPRYLDGINIIPSIKEIINFDTQTAIEISNVPHSQRGRKITYEFPFTLGENVIGYYNNTLFGSTISTVNQTVKVLASCDTCEYPPNENGDQSLPLQNGCAIYITYKKGTTSMGPYLISGSLDIAKPMQVGTMEASGINLQTQNYTAVVEIYTGKSTVLEPGPLYGSENSVQIQLSWDVYNSTLVSKIGKNYDIPVGGHRIKKIKTYENLTAQPIVKEYSYKDENNTESGILNVKLDNFFAFNNYFYLVSENYYPLQFHQGQPTGYSHVTERTSANSKVKIATYKYLYFSNADSEGYGSCYLFNGSYGKGNYPCIDDPINGKLIEHKIGLDQTTITDYETPSPTLNIKNVIGFNVANRTSGQDFSGSATDYSFAKYKISSFHDQKPWQVTSIENLNGSEIKTITTNTYDTNSHIQLKSTTNTVSGNETRETRLYYPTDLVGKPLMNELKLANRISTPVKTETYRNSTKINENLTTYKRNSTSNHLILPSAIYSANFPNNLPDLPNIGSLDRNVTFDLYDIKGNILQYTTEGGNKVSIIWGYHKTKPIAKLENIAYNLINPQTIVQLQGKSDADKTATTETSLRDQLNTLITMFPDAIITTYTHDPLIGITSLTDPKGYTTHYTYDEFGRLHNVKDMNLNILSTNSYYYKN